MKRQLSNTMVILLLQGKKVFRFPRRRGLSLQETSLLDNQNQYELDLTMLHSRALEF